MPVPTLIAVGSTPPWFFGPKFRRAAAGGAVIGLVIHFGIVAWMVRLRPDPTEILVLGPEAVAQDDSVRLRVFVRDGRASDIAVPGAEVTARWAAMVEAAGRGRTEADGVAEIVLPTPRLPTGETEWCRVTARGKTGRNRADFPVRLLPGPVPGPEAGGGIRAPGGSPVFAEVESGPVPEGGLRVDLVPESGELVRHVENLVWVRTTGPEGSPVRAVVITGGASRVETDGNGVGVFRLVPESGDADEAGRLTVSARDEAGREVREQRRLPVGSRSAGLLLRPESVQVRAGDSVVTADVFTASRAARVFVDWIQEGRVLGSATVPLAERRGRAETRLAGAGEGWVRVEAWAIPATGEPVSDMRWIRVVAASAEPEENPGALGMRLAEASGRETMRKPARGRSYAERREGHEAQAERARRSRLVWLGWGPGWVALVAGAGMILPGAAPQGDPVPGVRRGMRRLGLGMAAGAGALAGIAAWWPPGPGQVGAMIVATAVGFVGLAVGSRDVRDLPGAGERAPGLRRIAALAPVVFGAGGAAWLGTAWAERWGAPGAWAGPGTWGIGWVAAVGARVLVSFLGGRPVKG